MPSNSPDPVEKARRQASTLRRLAGTFGQGDLHDRIIKAAQFYERRAEELAPRSRPPDLSKSSKPTTYPKS
jgi:hypothetical protein